jgi:hypothetical protein
MLATKVRASTAGGPGPSPAPKALVVANAVLPYITAYSWGSSGFLGTYSIPATPPTGTGRGVAFSPDEANIAVAHTTTPYITAYP